MQARWMDNNTGRFISRDPIKDGYNWYAYCAGNPISYVDPTGLTDVPPIFINPNNGETAIIPIDINGGSWAGMSIDDINAALANSNAKDPTVRPILRNPDPDVAKQKEREYKERLVKSSRPDADRQLGSQSYRGERDSQKSMVTGNEEPSYDLVNDSWDYEYPTLVGTDVTSDTVTSATLYQEPVVEPEPEEEPPTPQELYAEAYRRYIEKYYLFRGMSEPWNDKRYGSPLGADVNSEIARKSTYIWYYEGSEHATVNSLDWGKGEGEAIDYRAKKLGVEGDPIYLSKETTFNLGDREPQRWYRGITAESRKNFGQNRYNITYGVAVGFFVTGQEPAGNYVLYGHLQPGNEVANDFAELTRLARAAGLRSFSLPAGTQIGKMGDTGRSTSAHLHFERSHRAFTR